MKTEHGMPCVVCGEPGRDLDLYGAGGIVCRNHRPAGEFASVYYPRRFVWHRPAGRILVFRFEREHDGRYLLDAESDNLALLPWECFSVLTSPDFSGMEVCLGPDIYRARVVRQKAEGNGSDGTPETAGAGEAAQVFRQAGESFPAMDYGGGLRVCHPRQGWASVFSLVVVRRSGGVESEYEGESLGEFPRQLWPILCLESFACLEVRGQKLIYAVARMGEQPFAGPSGVEGKALRGMWWN